MTAARAAPDGAAHEVFVYGTLLPGMANAAAARAAGLLASRPGAIDGAALWHLEPEGYPALVPGRGRVHGAVLRVRELAPLDALEGLGLEPPLYRRERWPLVGGGRVWVYVYARPGRLRAAGATPLPSGRWRPGPSTRPDR